MSIARWNPFRELEEMNDRFDRMFGRSLARGDLGRESLKTADWSPAVDISETDSEYLIKAEIPDVKKEEVKVQVEGGVLSIEGERKRETEEKGKRFHRVERFYGSFQRSFSLPDNVDPQKVQAEFKDGVLNVHLPKSAKPQPKSIDVKVA